MALNIKTGRAALARPNVKEGGEIMTDKDLEVPTDDEPKKASPPPHFMKDKRVKVCGKWQKKGYRPSTAEQKLWVAKCKSQNRDPKTGALKEKKAKK